FVYNGELEFFLPWSQSLKDKRQEIKSIKDRIKTRFNAAVAEVGFKEEWQRALIVVVLVGDDKRALERESALIMDSIQSVMQAHLNRAEWVWL
ncbi:MAG TPA: DUF503 domain-containing protein, partial [Pseudomonadales bacterium]|nr:DUF503 domain-containing protein [Pseudomonadales bacterium]